MSTKIDSDVNLFIEKILEWTDENADRAHQIAQKLASLDWNQVLLEQQQKEIRSQMIAMENFLDWRERGGRFCSECKEDNYVGGYRRGPYYEKVYSWPYAISPYTWDEDYMQGKHFCRKCFYKMEEELRNRIYFEQKEQRPEVPPNPFRSMFRCGECDRLIPYKSGYRIEETPQNSNIYCLHCVGSVAERRFIFCQICGKKTANSTDGYCYDCYPIQRAYGSQVSTHLGRARAAATPATLTISQWVAVLEYFHGKCAYCQSRPSQVIEHFIPISLGGGTTAENCVPACQRCNNRKGNKPPERLTEIFQSHAIERIKAYLQGDKARLKVRPTSCRALVAV
jgi:5-methylcytosine-specific restriction endonuclease McrA